MAGEQSNPFVFPQAMQVGDVAKTSGGLELRDYFAGTAITGIMANSDLRQTVGNLPDTMAEFAYQLAEAMLKERAK